MFLIAAVAAGAIGVSHPAASMPTMPTSTTVSMPRLPAPSSPRSTAPRSVAVPNLVRSSPFRVANLHALNRIYRFAGWPEQQCVYDWRRVSDEPPYFETLYRPEDCLQYTRPDLSSLYQADTQIQTLGQNLSPWHRFKFIDTDGVTFP
jgi:hypothetical protein